MVKLFDFPQIAELALPDATDITLSPETWAILQLAITYAIDPDLWVVDESDVNALDALLAGAVAELMDIDSGGGGVDLPDTVGPIVFDALVLHNSLEPTLIYKTTSDWLHCHVYQQYPAAGLPIFEVKVYLNAGDYRLRVLYNKGPSHGRFFASLSGPMAVSSDLIDGYLAVTAYNFLADKDVEITIPGEYDLAVVVTDKNPLSSNYYCGIQAVIVMRI